MEGKTKRSSQKKKLSPNTHGDFIQYSRARGIEANYPEVSPDRLNFKQRRVYNFITNGLKTGKTSRLLCIGVAGTGKSFIVAALRPFLRQNAIRYCVMAYTGSASFNIQGRTIHSTVSIPLNFRKHVPERNLAFVRSKLFGVQLIIIDEISMLGLDLFGYVERRIRAAIGSDKPFGNVHMLLMGDFAQLPPVGSRMIFHTDPNASTEDLEADGRNAYSVFRHCIFLDEIMRQGEEQALFRGILSRIRVGEVSDDDVLALQSRSLENIQECDLVPFLDYPFLFGERAKVDAYNSLQELDKQGFETIVIKSVDTHGSPGTTLEVCVGARVMINRNLFVEAGICTGAMATVSEISSERDKQGFPMFIFLKLDVYKGTPFGNRADIPFVPVEYPVYEPSVEKTVKRKQFPFVCSFARTVHTSQGQTFDGVVIGLPPPGEYRSLFSSMTPQLLYVALGRCRTLEGVIFSQPFRRELVSNRGVHLRQWQIEHQRLLELEQETPDHL